MTTAEPRRCVRGARCEDRTPGEDPQSGDRMWLPADTGDEGRAFCPVCTRAVTYSLGSLPWDVADLTLLLPPTLQVRYRDPGMPTQPRIRKGSPLGFRAEPYTLIERIDHELQVWAASVATEIDAHPPDRAMLAAMRTGRRVQECAGHIADHLDYLLGLPEQRHPAFSMAADPRAGHHTDHLTVTARAADAGETRYWARRNGTDAGLLFLALRAQAEHILGKLPADRCPIPCPACHRPSLVREHARGLTAHISGPRHGLEGRVVCKACYHQLSDQAYDELAAAVEALFGVAAS